MIETAGTAREHTDFTIDTPGERVVRRRAEALRAAAVSDALGHVVRRVARFLQDRRERRDARRDTQELERLSNRMLADIGFLRDGYDGAIQRAANDVHGDAASPRRVA